MCRDAASAEPDLLGQREKTDSIEWERDRRIRLARIVLNHDGTSAGCEERHQPTEHISPLFGVDEMKRVGDHESIERGKNKGQSEIGKNGLDGDPRVVPSESVSQPLERLSILVDCHDPTMGADDLLDDRCEHSVTAADIGLHAASREDAFREKRARFLEATLVRGQWHYGYRRSGFDGVTGPDPCLESAQDGRHLGEAVFKQDLRRTGA